MSTRPVLRRAAVLATAAALAVPALTSPAEAATLGTPSSLRIAGVSHTAVTASVRTTSGATGYRLYVSRTRSDVYVRNISRARRSALSRSPRITMTGLGYTTARYWYRIAAFRGSSRRFTSSYGSFSLRPNAPTGLRVVKAGRSLQLGWTASGATGAVVDQATSPDFRSGHRSYTLRDTLTRLSPYGLTAGRPSYFRVRSFNGTTGSGWSPRITVTPGTHEQNVTVMTYNVLEGTTVGTRPTGGEVIRSWADRRAGVVSLVREAAPDILMVQEAAAWAGSVHGYGGRRQVDDLVSHLPGYALARTEVPPSEHGYFRTGDYVLYRTATYGAVGTGGFWTLSSNGHWAAYQLLQDRATGARVVAVSPHLTPAAGLSGDRDRQRETQSLLSQGSSYAAKVAVPIVYAGDVNSNTSPGHALDGPGVTMRSAGIADAEYDAVSLTNMTFNSANGYKRTPPRFSDSVDHVYAPAGVAARSLRMLLHLSGGRFVGVIPSDHNPLVAALTYRY